MTSPLISCVCVTYGRVKWLEEAIATFQAQDYPNRELVILNTFPRQQLDLEHPDDRIRIVNEAHRPPSLGNARNIGISVAKGDVIVTWDDDDIPLPNHLSTIAKAFTDGTEWVWIDAQFYMQFGVIEKITPGSCPLFAFTKEAWDRAGGYPNLTVGEDRGFIAAVQQVAKGTTIHVDEPTYIYAWGQGVYHASGQGDDRPGRDRAHDRIEGDLQRRVRMNEEPVGVVVLHPKLKQDYAAQAKKFMDDWRTRQPGPNAVCLVQLGRAGDIMNMLPIARHLKRQGKDVWLATSNEFAGLLEGVSYARPYPLAMPFDALTKGMLEVGLNFSDVINCQIYGWGVSQEKQCPTFNEESWRIAGFGDHFRDREFPLVFDRRFPTREEALLKRAFRTQKPKIVTNLTSASSAPFPQGRAILASMVRAFPQYEVVDIGELRCHRIFDLLGIMEKARVFVTIDTATLHLNLATNVPMIAIVRDGWEGAEPRWGCARKFLYSEARKNPEAVVEAARKVLES